MFPSLGKAAFNEASADEVLSAILMPTEGKAFHPTGPLQKMLDMGKEAPIPSQAVSGMP